MELFGDKGISTPVGRVGWPDQFIEHASSVDHLRNKYGLTADRAVELARSLGQRRQARGLTAVA
jgi:1-deoxy-D-xylulose-5-phosphate synthase